MVDTELRLTSALERFNRFVVTVYIARLKRRRHTRAAIGASTLLKYSMTPAVASHFCAANACFALFLATPN